MGKKEKEKEPDLKDYFLFGNLQYALKRMVQIEGTSSVFICMATVFFGVLLPFLAAALPGVTVKLFMDKRAANWTLILISGYIILLQIIRVLQGYTETLWQNLSCLFRMDLVDEFYAKLVEVDGQFLESGTGQRKIAEAKKNLYAGSGIGIEAYLIAFTSVLKNFLGAALYAAVVGRYHVALMLIMLIQTVAATGFYAAAKKQEQVLEEKNKKNWNIFWYLRKETIDPTNGKDIRLYQLGKWFHQMFLSTIEKIVRIQDKEQTGYMIARIGGNVLSFFRNLLIYSVFVYQMMQENLTLAEFLLYIGLVAGFESWMSGLLNGVQELFQNDIVMSQYRSFMDVGADKEKDKSKKISLAHPGEAHEIRLEQVCFCYEGCESDTLHNLNLTIRSKERLALVGMNGAGKTTLIKLICGLYRPTSGKIYLDGQDVETLSLKEYFREFSVVFQDVFAFSFQLAENVSCQSNNVTDVTRLESALQKSGLAERVKKLEKGYHTIMNQDLDEEGVTLSGGEMQKLMLARALYKDAPVIILDEPTAALDPIAESEMYGKYNEMLKKKTGIFISHRLSSTRFCDRILFLENGRIKEEGSHEELMKQNGDYAKMIHAEDSIVLPLHLLKVCVDVAKVYIGLFVTANFIDALMELQYRQAGYWIFILLFTELLLGTVGCILKRRFKGIKNKLWLLFFVWMRQKAFSLDYETIEKPETAEKIIFSEHTSDMYGGLGKLLYHYVEILQAVINILASVSMVILLCLSKPERGNGMLVFINEPFVSLILFGGVLGGMILCSEKCSGYFAAKRKTVFQNHTSVENKAGYLINHVFINYKVGKVIRIFEMQDMLMENGREVTKKIRNYYAYMLGLNGEVIGICSV